MRHCGIRPYLGQLKMEGGHIFFRFVGLLWLKNYRFFRCRILREQMMATV